jgi:hypothetical protein
VQFQLGQAAGVVQGGATPPGARQRHWLEFGHRCHHPRQTHLGPHPQQPAGRRCDSRLPENGGDIRASIGDDYVLLPFIQVANTSQVFVAGASRNADNFGHIQLLGTNTFGFEDLTGGGDADFDDLILRVNSL